ncbi:sll0787 family AIR synthase-like protein [Methylomonas koyamae]|uniref:sll0787 family AIR synthase-like protein n=1 Tax=Methylomonas koyamae TaxID=702114 RepID=UPI002873807D|nr:sll0787 family AIR synthase-like protein [Methylomonas koyamae]WNB74769.1 sll0787 family AIR synthase-like protein [Methylomonas koyamae]
MSELAELTLSIRQGLGLAHKRDIAEVMEKLYGFQTVGRNKPLGVSGEGLPETPAVADAGRAYSGLQDHPVGDDCAAIPDGDGYLLLATEGYLNDFVATQPWFAGYCGVMVNVSDIYAMGGRPIAVVDAIWSDGAPQAKPILEGLATASQVYGVPVVGGHSNLRNDRPQLSVAILGRAQKLLSSFAAKPGQQLLVAIDLRGHFREPYLWWDASTGAPPERLRQDLEILPTLAETGLCAAAKDISNAGIVGTLLMLLECSDLGGTVDIQAIPRPAGIVLERWLSCFPSFGFVLSVDGENSAAVIERFTQRGIACAAIGTTDTSRQMRLASGDEQQALWDLNEQPLTGCGPIITESPSPSGRGDGVRVITL